ncbi:MAG: flagellar motor switch protein FliM [Vampirovibrionales bacterium]
MMMMMLSQDEIDSLLSNLSVSSPTATAQPPVVTATTPITSTTAPLGALSPPSSAITIADILSEEKQKNYKIYNFKSPDKFSKDTLRAIETIHETFARNASLLLGAYLRTSITIDVVSVDQLTYDEFIRSMPRPISVVVMEMIGLKYQQLLGMSHEITMSFLDRLLGGVGHGRGKPRELTDLEINILQKVFKRFLECLSDSWKPIFPGCSITQKGFEESYTALQITSPGEIVAAVTFEVNIANRESGLLSLCIPFPCVERSIHQLSTQHLFSGKLAEDEDQPQQTEEILSNVNYAHIPISASIGGCQLSMYHILHMQAGDVLMLDRLAGSDMLVCVNKKPKFYGSPGVRHGHLAICINEKITDAEAVKGFALNEENESFC